MWLGLSIQRMFACGADFQVLPFCRVPVYTGYLELGSKHDVPVVELPQISHRFCCFSLLADLASDLWLIGAPLTMLWKIKLSTYHRRLIGGAFVCGIATTIASIVHIYFIIVKDDVWTGFSGHIQACVGTLAKSDEI